MAIEHDAIADGERHEPKGIAAAAVNDVYLADGAASGSWQHMNPHAGMFYTNIGTGTTFTTPTTYTLLNMATTATQLDEFTHNSLGRITYTGTETRHFHLAANLTVKHSTGTGQDVFFGWHKNGVLQTGGEAVQTADSANYDSISMHWDTVLTTNDYMELFVKVATGDSIIHTYYMFAIGMPN